MSDKPSLILLPGGNANGTGVPDMPPNWSEIVAMLKVDGFYVAGDTNDPGVSVAIVVIDGAPFALDISRPLNPTRFPPTATFAGPFTSATKVVHSTVPPAENDDG